MSDELQALCFLAGANSIFAGEKLLTQKNPGEDQDRALIEKLGMKFQECAHNPNGTHTPHETKREKHHHLMVTT
jgi:biotin synthase